MLNAVLFFADSQLANLLQGMARESNEFKIETVVEHSLTGYPVARTLNMTSPDVILVEMTEPDRDLPQAAAIHKYSPNVPVIGLASRDYQDLFRRNANSDFASLVGWPFGVNDLEQAISVAVHEAHGGIHENLISFLPGKAGSGASTVVLQTAHILAQELKRHVLVLEGDLHSGLLSAMLNVKLRSSIRDALADAADIDSLKWAQHIITAGGVDFLLTNTAKKEPVPSWAHYFKILRFAAPRYDVMMMDLPEVVNSATAEVVRRSRIVYVVSTPEFASLTLSKQRCQELDRWGVDRARIQVLLNRGHKNDMGAKDAERILEYPVAATFPNDYKALRRTITDGGSVDVHSDLGEAYLALARSITGAEVEKKSFLKMFRK